MYAQACELFLIHPTAEFFNITDFMYITVFVHVSHGACVVAASYQNHLLWGATKSLVQVIAFNNATLTNVVVPKKHTSAPESYILYKYMYI